MPSHSPRAEPAAAVARRLRDAGPLALDDGEALQLIGGLRLGEAEALLDEFGSLVEVLAQEPGALMRIVSEARAARLGLARDLVRRVLLLELRERPLIPGLTVVADYLRALLGGLPREEFRVLFLDNRNRLIRDEVVNRGTVDHAPVYPREVMRRALELNASALVLAHNHPAGDPKPSPADVEMTARIAEAGRALRITVHDHILVAGAEAVSFRAQGLL
ncbi:MAG: hypothetical protein DI570_08815 [Phenylobacterium zucineum]|nr:MAG: hypothetical protein DI570_08815 [Phenylobacterium zucineum]